MLVRTSLVEVGSAMAAVALLVLAVVWWRRGDLVRRALGVACLVGCAAAGAVAAHSHGTLAAQRAEKCGPTVHRALCG